jgi:prephenate dehydrogenase
MNIRIVGAGLIGTSMGLGLVKKGHKICFEDNSTQNLHIAQDLLGECSTFELADLVVVATPISSLFSVLEREFLLNPQAAFIDISGLKSDLVSRVEDFPELARRFCGTHPMAGREIAGPTGARADLFQGATWIVTPTEKTASEVVETVKTIISELGGVVREVEAPNHDRAISSVSHLPQILSTLLAGHINAVDESAVALAGQGLRDMTRLADSNAELWTELLTANSLFVAADLRVLQEKLSKLIDALDGGHFGEVKEILIDGNSGKSKIPGKHGKPSREYAYLPIVIDDKPGQLASIFDECAETSVNVEDLFIEHSPGQDTGLITLALSQGDATVLRSHLVNRNWRVHDIRAHR